MWNTDEKPEDMPLEEWLWVTGQKSHKSHEDDSEEI